MRRLPWPRSLPGQMALLVALALFVAQAINFAMLLSERRALRFQEITGPAAARIVDAAEQYRRGTPEDPETHWRVHLVDHDPIAQGLERAHDVEAAMRQTLTEAGLKVGRVDTGVRSDPGDDDRASPGRARYAHFTRFGSALAIAVEWPGHGWLVQHVPWPRTDAAMIWPLIAQTLILYVIVLLPVLWIGRRIARPLRTLAAAADGFRPGDAAPPVAESGPHDVRALIAAFNALRRRVTAMLDEKDRMLGAIGHDLRTPLAALRVRIESVEDDTDRTRMAATIEEMNRTLDDILSLARLGRPSEPPIDVDLAALVDAVVEDFVDLGAPVTLEETPRLTMRLRPALMRRAVRNLIENAVKYGDRAAVRIAPGAQSVAIIVADDGPGIPPDRLSEVFDPFTRLESSRNRETGGIGLGLALARAIVADAGGSIRLSNRDGGGLDAVIALPR